MSEEDEPVDGPTGEYRKETAKKLEREKEVDTIDRDIGKPGEQYGLNFISRHQSLTRWSKSLQEKSPVCMTMPAV
jgi:hypothetical protein